MADGGGINEYDFMQLQNDIYSLKQRVEMLEQVVAKIMTGEIRCLVTTP